MASAASIRAGAAYVELYLQDNRFTRGLKASEKSLRSFASSAKEIGTALSAAFGAAALPAAYSLKTFAAFEDQMKAVQGVSGATGREFDLLYEKAKELGRTTSFTAGEVAGGMLSLSRAGFSPKEIDAAIASMLNLARASGTDLATASDIAANTLRSFGLEASDMTRVADVLVATANGSVQTVEDLGEAMKYASASAADTGISLEETSKAMGVMANFGIKGSMAGTSFRRMLLSLADPKVQTRLESMGVTVLDTAKNIRTDVGNVLAEIGTATAKMPTGERLALFKEMFDLRGMSGALKMANADFPKLIKAIDEAAGTAERTSKIMDSGLGGAFRRMLSGVEGVVIAFGESLSGAVGVSADAVAGYTQKIVEAIKTNQEFIGKLATVVIGIGAAAAAFIALAVAIKAIATTIGIITAITKAIGGLAAAATFLAMNPLVAVWAAVGLVAVAFVDWGTVIKSVMWYLGKLIPSIDDFANATKRSIGANQEEQAAIRQKAERLAELRAKTEKTVQEMEEMAVITQSLKSAFPGLSSEIDNLGTSTDATAKAMKALNDAMRARQVAQLKTELIAAKKAYAALNREAAKRQEIKNELERRSGKPIPEAIQDDVRRSATGKPILGTSDIGRPNYDILSSNSAELRKRLEATSDENMEAAKAMVDATREALAQFEAIGASAGGGPSAGSSGSGIASMFSNWIKAAGVAGTAIGQNLWDGINRIMDANKKASEEFLPDLKRAQAEGITDPMQRDLAIARVEWAKRIADAKKERAVSFTDWAKSKGISTSGLEDSDERGLRRQYEKEVPTLPTGLLEQARDVEIGNIQNRYAREAATRQEDLDNQIAQETIRATKEGSAEEKALLELERQQALRNAEKEGLDASRVNQLYDLKASQIDSVAKQGIGTETSGTFSGFAAAMMGGGTAAERTAEATEKTAAIIERLRNDVKNNTLVYVA